MLLLLPAQVVAAPALALLAATLELRSPQNGQNQPPVLQEALLGPATLERTSSTFSVNPTLLRAASMLS